MTLLHSVPLAWCSMQNKVQTPGQDLSEPACSGPSLLFPLSFSSSCVGPSVLEAFLHIPYGPHGLWGKPPGLGLPCSLQFSAQWDPSGRSFPATLPKNAAPVPVSSLTYLMLPHCASPEPDVWPSTGYTPRGEDFVLFSSVFSLPNHHLAWRAHSINIHRTDE